MAFLSQRNLHPIGQPTGTRGIPGGELFAAAAIRKTQRAEIADEDLPHLYPSRVAEPIKVPGLLYGQNSMTGFILSGQ